MINFKFMPMLRLLLLPLALTAFSSPAQAGERLSVLTYNIWNMPSAPIVGPLSSHHKLRAIALCDELRKAHKDKEGWDVIFLQEAWRPETRESLQDCGYHAVDLNSEFKTGLMILSRYEAKDATTLKFSVNGYEGFKYSISDGENQVQKGVLAVKFQAKKDGPVFWAVNTHMIAWYGEDKSYNDHREIQIRELDEFLRKIKTDSDENEIPVLLGGDLNAGPAPLNERTESWELVENSILSYMQQPDDVDTKTIETYSVKNKILDTKGNRVITNGEGQIDHIFFTSQFKYVANSSRLAFEEEYDLKEVVTPLSDHFGWSLELELSQD